ILWYRPEMLNSKDLVPLDALYTNQDVFVTRDTWVRAEQNTFAGIKGGAANHGHAHGDIGKFEFFANGVQWTAEAGGLDYNAPDYWNWHGGEDNGPAGKRWQYWGTRGEAHNTLIIDPDSQFEFDPFEKATLYHTESKPRGSIAILNTTPIHRGKAIRAERGMMMTDERRSLVVRDEVTVTKPCKVYWHMLTRQEAKLSEDGKSVIISESGNPDNFVTLDFVCDAEYKITVDRPSLLPNSPDSEYNTVDATGYQIRVEIDAKDAVNLTAKLTPSTVENGSEISAYDMPMSGWSIPDGEIPELPVLDTLTVDGIEYNPNTKTINHFVSQSKTEVPDIVAASDRYNVEIQKADSLSDIAVIVVSDKADSSNRSTYKIRFSILKSTGVEGVEERDIISVTASEEPQVENPVKHVLDRDLSTRWSAENAQHIVVDLGKVCEFDTVIMAFMSGKGRFYNIKMSVSDDNDSYKQVYSGTSGGETDDYEKFDIGLQKARYIKIEGAGHKEGTWNSWTEIAIAKKK
ncbi:MAG: heparinase II/III family protein, partial [Clostridia bacterium]|nr:heparinase II/III family protein [Clostridia bacterium]